MKIEQLVKFLAFPLTCILTYRASAWFRLLIASHAHCQARTDKLRNQQKQPDTNFRTTTER